MKIIEEIDALVSSKISQIKTMLTIVKLEVRLAGLSVYPLLLNICMLAVVLMSVWFSCMLLLGHCFMLLFDNMLIAISSIIFLNGALSVGLFKYLKFNLQKMSFEKTRGFISNKENEDHERKKKNNFTNSQDGNNTALSKSEGVRT
jgi:hypothetical protein